MPEWRPQVICEPLDCAKGGDRLLDIIPVAISVLALGLSGLTAWLTLLRRGTIHGTQPAVVYFGPDGGLPDREPSPKVFLRCLLYSTGRRGNVVENMFVRVRRGETLQSFNIWVYGDQTLTRGSGLHVGPDGVATNHHFLLPADGSSFEFLPGTYRVALFASLVGNKEPKQLLDVVLVVGEAESRNLRGGGHGLYFDWGPDSMRYHPHIKQSPKLSTEVAELLRRGAV